MNAGLTAKNTYFEAILALRGYCKYPRVGTKRLSRSCIEKLQRIMQDDVIAKVSNNVLKKQLELLREADTKCDICAYTENSAAVTEKVTVPLTKNLVISRIAQARVTWHSDCKSVGCSCNGLVYGGKPCLHILYVAQRGLLKIPIQCFNSRFFFLSHIRGASSDDNIY